MSTPTDADLWAEPTASYTEWARRTGIPIPTIASRLQARGWVRLRGHGIAYTHAPCALCGVSRAVEALDAGRECVPSCRPPEPIPERAPVLGEVPSNALTREELRAEFEAYMDRRAKREAAEDERLAKAQREVAAGWQNIHVRSWREELEFRADLYLAPRED